MMRISIPAGFKQRAQRHWVLGSCILALLSFLTLKLVGENGYLDRRQRQQQMEALSAEIEQLRQENERLSQRIQDLRSSPQAIEELARERLRLARPGEVIVTLPPSQPSGQSAEGRPSRTQ